MAYCDDLIKQAVLLCEPQPPDVEPNQANLRRAVSAAYYSVFHLLTTDAAANWLHARQRHRFARIFEHSRMKKGSEKTLLIPIPDQAPERIVGIRVRAVAEAFITLQQNRHTADYDHSRVWSRTQVYEEIYKASKAIEEWALVRDTDLGQDYLLDLLAGKRTVDNLAE
jgi:uncharacterized protein (UPF0332 family)